MAAGLTKREADLARAIADIQDRLDVIAQHEPKAALRIGQVLNEVLDALREKDPRVLMALEAEYLDREAREE